MKTNEAPPFHQARELYSELFEADKLETAMWHYSQMKPSEQRFIQTHLLYLTVHGLAVTNLNLRSIRGRLEDLEQHLQAMEPEGDREARDQETEAGDSESGDDDEGDEGEDRSKRDDDPEDEDGDESPDEGVDQAVTGDAGLGAEDGSASIPADSKSPPSLQLQAAVSALAEAFNYEAAPESR